MSTGNGTMTIRHLQHILRNALSMLLVLPPVLLVVLLPVLLLAATPAQAWWHCDWDQRLRIDLPAAAPADELTELRIRRAGGAGTASINGLLAGNFSVSEIHETLRVVNLDDATEIPFYLDRQNGENSRNIRLWIKPTSSVSSFYLYLDHNNFTTITSASTPSIFSGLTASTQPGFRYHTRKRHPWRAWGDPQAEVNSLRRFFNRFDAQPDGVSGYGCTVLTDANNTIRNSARFPSGSDNNILTAITFILNVPGAEVWGIRYGGDFGDGGGIYVDGTMLDQKWGTNLWWSYSWGNTGELLSGSSSLSAGPHLITIYGGEDCCDGAASIQLRRPGDTWKTLNSANFSNYIRAPLCNAQIAPDPLAAPEEPAMRVTKTAAVVQDPINGSNNPHAISGARVRYTIKVEQTSKNPPDENTLQLRDVIPANAQFVATSPIPDVAGTVTAAPLLETTPATATGKTAVGPVMWWPDTAGDTTGFGGLTLNASDVAYSSTGSAPFTTAIPGSTNPTTGANSTVKAIQITPEGSSTACGTSTNPVRFFTEFDVLID